MTSGDLAAIHALVAARRKGGIGGRWSGDGINSSAAAANPLAGLATFSDARGVVVRYTWVGDLDGNGTVNADDYARIDAGYASHATGYGNGDVNYSGSINSDVYFHVDLGFASQGTPLAPAAARASAEAEATKKKSNAHHKRRLRHHQREEIAFIRPWSLRPGV